MLRIALGDELGQGQHQGVAGVTRSLSRSQVVFQFGVDGQQMSG